MFSSPLASKFHFSPFKLFRRSLSGKEERVFCEVYDSDAFNKENDKIQRVPVPPDDPGCKREKVVIALMFWSDATHLANFGTAKLWPIYMLLGNLSKYFRSQPNSVTQVLVNISHTSLLFWIHSKILLPIFIKNGELRRRIS
jgi:hypothetical protein